MQEMKLTKVVYGFNDVFPLVGFDFTENEVHVADGRHIVLTNVEKHSIKIAKRCVQIYDATHRPNETPRINFDTYDGELAKPRRLTLTTILYRFDDSLPNVMFYPLKNYVQVCGIEHVGILGAAKHSEDIARKCIDVWNDLKRPGPRVPKVEWKDIQCDSSK